MTDTTPESQGAPETQAAPEAQQTVPSPVEQPGAWPEPQGATPADQAPAPDAGAAAPEPEPQPTNADGTAIPTPDATPDATVAAPDPAPDAALDPAVLDPAPEPEQPVQNLSQQAPDADPNPAFHGDQPAAPEIEHPTHEAYSPDPAPGTVV